jgi:hypothetical protein
MSVGPPKPPVTAESIKSEWTDMIRDLLHFQHHKTRGPADSPVIEIKSHTTGEWHKLMLPGGGFTFTSTSERDILLERIK